MEIKQNGKDFVSFQYNAGMNRAAMYYGGTQTYKLLRRYRKYYSGDGSMEITFDKTANKTTFVTFIGGDAYSAPIIWHSDQGSTTTNNYYYLHRDYLGSVLAITNKEGVVQEKRHFDAWGNIVKLQDGAGANLTAFKILDRGHTGHEHLLGVGLINMNARLYDPILHRFLAPDNFIQDPFNTQNFNRYGYVLNNPLKFTDPSGNIFFVPLLIGIAYGALIGAATAAVVYTVSSLITQNWSLSGLGTAVLYGAIGGAISGGLGVAASLASSSTSSFLQSTTLNMLTELASQAGAGALMGDRFTLGTVAGAIAGSFASAKLGDWSGVKGGWAKNAVGELGFNTAKGAARGAITGGVAAAINKENIGDGLAAGARNGALGGFSQSLSMIATFGATYKPSSEKLQYANKMADAFGLSTDKVAFRKGGLYQVVQPLWSGGFKREVTWGRNVVSFNDTSASTFGHEYGHVIQVQQQGWSAFQGRGIYEQLIWGANAYNQNLHPNSNEVGADKLFNGYGRN